MVFPAVSLWEPLKGRALTQRVRSRFATLQDLVNRRASFRFQDRWRIQGSVADVAAVLLDTSGMTGWWPPIREVETVAVGDVSGIGRAFRLRINGFLPYELLLSFEVTHALYPSEFQVTVGGHFVGHGSGVLRQVGSHVEIDFVLDIQARHRGVRLLAMVVRPLLAAQHYWVMSLGANHLNRLLLCRQPVWNGAA
jgi:hypothetical protein